MDQLKQTTTQPRPYNDHKDIERFSLRERLVHWTVAVSFVYLMLSGLALYFPRLYWIASLLGGGTTIRVWHPYVGVVFIVAFTIMFYPWKRCMLLYPEDWEWLRNIWSYITHRDKTLPEIGRFDPGQKIFFWLMASAGVLLFVSGIPLWFPDKFSWNVRLVSIFTHEVASTAAIAGIIAHIYMGTIGVPGALSAMTRGKVTQEWAKTHHARWYRRLKEKGII
ncbi:MAG: formate dehydrogenase subunit gamma [Candidatus Brocadiales bacterium]|nr:formate dehydrogenase subunit gamma [Candidatus Brocadiales bacterium]